MAGTVGLGSEARISSGRTGRLAADVDERTGATPPRTISVVLVEDDQPTREFLAASLAVGDGIELLAACASLAEARAALARAAPKVLITDLKLPDGSGIDLIHQTRRAHPNTEVMVISVLGDETTVMAAVQAGASGYILKDARSVDLIAAVRDLVEGRSPISASIARHIIRQVHRQSPAPADDPKPPLLTPREMDILWGIAKGFTYNDIADSLGISRATVPSYIKSIYRKLEVNSRSEAVFAAVEMKLIKLSE